MNLCMILAAGSIKKEKHCRTGRAAFTLPGSFYSGGETFLFGSHFFQCASLPPETCLLNKIRILEPVSPPHLSLSLLSLLCVNLDREEKDRERATAEQHEDEESA